ncbi:MAG TPA: VIT family protein [Polyangiaceae bacterium]|jgi:VIT1/CCC1 family predicted Fe2+/Mn2+ transporter
MANPKREARPRPHHEGHVSSRGAWLRAAILGADDGIVSISSLMLGVAASGASKHAVLVAGVAGIAAGALSMAAGEYVSVSSQRDAEEADIDLEKWELADNPSGELRELASIYEKRGLEPALARKVAEQLSTKNRLDAHLRDELGLTEGGRARPLQAGLVSAASFSSLALVPILALLIAPEPMRIVLIAASALVSLGCMGALGGHVAGAPRLRAALRVLIGGGLAMAVSALVGRLFGVVQG